MWPNLKPITFGEAQAEGLQGPSMLNALRQQKEELQKAKLFNQFYPQKAQADIQHQNLVNQFYPELTRADITNKNALARMHNFNVDNPIINTEEGKLAYIAAHPELFGNLGGGGQQNNLVPSQGGNQNQIQKLVGSLAPGQTNQLKEAMNQPLFMRPKGMPIPDPSPNAMQQPSIAEMANQRYAADTASKQALANYRSMGGPNQGVDQKRLNSLRQQIQNEHQDWSPQLVDEAQSAYLTGNYQLTNGQELPEPSGTVNSMLRNIQNKTTDKDVRMRVRFAENIDKTLSRVNPNVINEFTGPNGIKKLAAEELKARKGSPSKLLTDYKNFVNVQVPILTKQIRQFYGDSIQPSVAEGLKEVANPTHWYNNPELARAQYDELVGILEFEMETFKEGLGGPIKQSKGANQKQFQQGSKKDYTEKDIENTAKKYNMTREEVIKILESKNG